MPGAPSARATLAELREGARRAASRGFLATEGAPGPSAQWRDGPLELLRGPGGLRVCPGPGHRAGTPEHHVGSRLKNAVKSEGWFMARAERYGGRATRRAGGGGRRAGTLGRGSGTARPRRGRCRAPSWWVGRCLRELRRAATRRHGQGDVTHGQGEVMIEAADRRRQDVLGSEEEAIFGHAARNAPKASV